MSRRRKTLSWQIKLPLLLMLFSVAPIGLLGLRIFDIVEETYQHSTLDSLRALARAKADAIDQFTDDRRSDVERISQLISARISKVLAARAKVAEQEELAIPEKPPPLQDAEAFDPSTPTQAPPPELDTPTTPPKQTPPPEEAAPPGDDPSVVLEEARAALNRSLALILWDQQQFEELLVIDTEGQVVASTFGGHLGKTAADLGYFQSGLRGTYVQPPFLSPITQRHTMVISTPIRDEQGGVQAVLAARLNLTWFFRLINDLSGLGETGETVVGKLVEDKVVFMAPTRHDAGAALERAVQIDSEGTSALALSARGQNGQGKTTDYREQCVYAAWEHIPSLEWGLLVKLDCGEAVAPLEAIGMQIIVFTSLLILVALLLALLVARALVKPLRELELAADRISKGDFDVEIDVRSNDEVGDLADSFERMVAAIKFFREHSRSEAEDAKRLHESGGDATAASSSAGGSE